MFEAPTKPTQVEWDDWRGGLATFSGPGGFTQVPMTHHAAASIAEALGLPFNVAAALGEERRAA